MADVESTKGRADIVPDVSEEPPFLKQGQVQLADVDDDEEFTVPEQRKIIHKVDHRLLVLLGLIQAVSFIDRANMSNAAVAGFVQPSTLYFSFPRYLPIKSLVNITLFSLATLVVHKLTLI